MDVPAACRDDIRDDRKPEARHVGRRVPTLERPVPVGLGTPRPVVLDVDPVLERSN